MGFVGVAVMGVDLIVENKITATFTPEKTTAANLNHLDLYHGVGPSFDAISESLGRDSFDAISESMGRASFDAISESMGRASLDAIAGSMGNC